MKINNDAQKLQTTKSNDEITDKEHNYLNNHEVIKNNRISNY